MKLDATKLQLLQSLLPGDCMWVRVGGTSMWPVLLNGDRVLVRRVDENALHVGDIAALILAGGVPAAHFVSAVDPLRTEGTAGITDVKVLRVIGKIEAVKRWNVRFNLKNVTWALRQWPLAYQLARRVPGLQKLGRALRKR